MFVKPATEVMTLADLGSVWVLAEVFERQAAWVATGQPASVHLSFAPGRKWQGQVEYVYPTLDPKTRTLKVRMRFDNPGETLKPNMYGDVTILAAEKSGVLKIPREALIRTGQEERVILAVGEGSFRPRKVLTGIESGDQVEIVAGLQAGDRVVTSGQFLIDSEASLKASLMRMSDAPEEAPADRPQDTAPSYPGSGVLKQVMPEQGKVNIQHEPIPALEWPAMTMDLQVDQGVSLRGLSPGDPVNFELREGEQGYLITNIRKADQ
jgi:Cu(I)/Ag(I) efflux system membrane fusion protein